MPFSYYQPYVVESSLTMPPEMFIGRENELISIKSPKGASLVYGGRQLGKTALLKRARQDVNARQDGSRAVLVDLKDKGVAESARRVSSELVDLCILDAGKETDNWSELARYITARLRGNDGEREIPFMLLMMDEADCFIADGRKDEYSAINELKSIQQACPDRFKFVLAGLHNIVRFNREDSLSGNCIMPHFSGAEINIKPFSYDEAEQLLTYPMSYLGFSFEENRELMDHILATTNYFPGLIQLYCRKLLECMRGSDYAGYKTTDTPPYVVTERHIRKVLTDAQFVAEIKNKFEITLRLDDYYYTIALLLALMHERKPSDIGYTAEEICAEADENCVVKLSEMSTELIEAWLLELCDLNVLRSSDSRHYMFSTKNFRDLMGSESEIMSRLNAMA